MEIIFEKLDCKLFSCAKIEELDDEVRIQERYNLLPDKENNEYGFLVIFELLAFIPEGYRIDGYFSYQYVLKGDDLDLNYLKSLVNRACTKVSSDIKNKLEIRNINNYLTLEVNWKNSLQILQALLERILP